MRIFILFTLCLLFSHLIKGQNDLSFNYVAAFNGTIPGDSNVGDLLGAGVTFGLSNFIVGAPAASPTVDGQLMDQAGAVYFYGPIDGVWQEWQEPFTVPYAFNQISSTIIASCGDWLFVAAPGTPLNQSNPQLKDLSGAVVVLQRVYERWIYSQTIYDPLGLQGAYSLFGFNLGCSDEWLVVGGAGVSAAYFYKLNVHTNQWTYTQNVTFPQPQPGEPGYVFVAVDGNTAMIGQPVPIMQQFNSKVYVYSYNGHLWSYTQTLEGFNNPLSQKYNNTGDFLGEFIHIDRNWAVISAPRDNEMGDITGAVYFVHFENGKWEIKQKVFSDKPSALFGFGAWIEDDLAVIGDCGRTVNGDLYRGAIIVYRRIGGVWVPLEDGLLIDPNGRPYDWFASGGIIIKGKRIGGGTDAYTDEYLPDGFPGKRSVPFNPPNNNGRAVLYSVCD